MSQKNVIDISQKSKSKILIIGLEPELLNFTERFLKDYNTHTCINVKEAMRLLEAQYNDISFIFCDAKSAMDRIRAEERYDYIPIVPITGKNSIINTTSPVTLVEYLVKLNEVLLYAKNLPLTPYVKNLSLFLEEIKSLTTLLREETVHNNTLLLKETVLSTIEKQLYQLNVESDQIFGKIQSQMENILRESDKLSGGGNYEHFPYPYIFKPPSPPGDLGIVGEPIAKKPITEEIQENEPYCKHCGSELAKGQSICHVCKNKVI